MMLVRKNVITAVLCLFIAFVFVQSLFFKYTDSAETLYIFSVLNQWAETQFGITGLFLPPGLFNAYVIGTAELVASGLLLAGLITRRKWLIPAGAALGLGVMSGAIVFHLFTPLGIEVMDDGGTLFYMACGVWLSCVVLVLLHLVEIKKLLTSFIKPM